MDVTHYIGERWSDPTGLIRVVTRAYPGAEGEVNADGSVVLWVVFDGNNCLTYYRIELPALGWSWIS